MKLTYNLKFQNGSTEQISVPTTWNDLTLDQVIKLSELADTDKRLRIKIIGICTGLEVEKLESITGTENLNLLNGIEASLQFINEKPVFKDFILPKEIELNKKKVKIPVDLKQEAYGQKVAIEELLRMAPVSEDGKIDLVNLMPEALSIYLYPLYCGESFKDERVEDFIPLMKTLNIKDAYPVASFFLIKRGIFFKMKN
jgi:hypothetical protein